MTIILPWECRYGYTKNELAFQEKWWEDVTSRLWLWTNKTADVEIEYSSSFKTGVEEVRKMLHNLTISCQSFVYKLLMFDMKNKRWKPGNDHLLCLEVKAQSHPLKQTKACSGSAFCTPGGHLYLSAQERPSGTCHESCLFGKTNMWINKHFYRPH